MRNDYKDIPVIIRFDGPPSHESGRFVETETVDGRGISLGKWKEMEGGHWGLEITSRDVEEAVRDALIEDLS